MFINSLNATMLCLTLALVIPEIVIGMGGKKPTMGKTANNDASVNVKVLKGNNIVFYNSDSTIKKEIKTALYPSFSPDKKRIVFIEDSRIDTISFFNQQGELIKKIKIPRSNKGSYYSELRIATSNNGSLTTIGQQGDEIYAALLSFYDSTISYISDVKLLCDGYRIAYIDNDNIAVLMLIKNKIDKYPAMEYTEKVELRCYQTDGHLKWKHTINDLNYLGADSTGGSLEKQGLDVLYVDEVDKRIYIKGVSNLGKTYKELWDKYERDINPEGKAIWIFDYDGKLIEEKRGW